LPSFYFQKVTVKSLNLHLCDVTHKQSANPKRPKN